MTTIEQRLIRERDHASLLLDGEERNWGWRTPAGRVRKLRRAQFVASVRAEVSAKVLEIGAGTGTFSGALGERFPHLTCIDISPDLLKVAAKRFPQLDFQDKHAHPNLTTTKYLSPLRLSNSRKRQPPHCKICSFLL